MADPRAMPDQISHILRSHDDAEIDNPNWRDDQTYGFIYRRGHVLTRQGDSVRVGRELNGYLRSYNERNAEGWTGQGDQREPPEPQIRVARNLPGSQLLGFSSGLDNTRVAEPSVPQILDEFDDTLGIGVARPDHVLTAASHACSATEPEEVRQGALPFPEPAAEVCTCGHCDGEGVLVSIVDTGLVTDAEVASPWLAGVQGDLDPYGPAGEILEYTGHGTFSAGCLRTIAPKAEVYVERGVQHGGSAYESELAVQFAEGLQRNPDIVIFCFAADTRKELSLLGFDVVFEDYVLATKGLTVLAPAGNEGTRKRKYPAASHSVLGVGALGRNWARRADFTGFGGWVDVYAPGEDLINAFATGTYECKWEPDKGKMRSFQGRARWSGTSFSTPIVAGLIAARMSATGENSTEATNVLMDLARANRRREVGPILLPGQGCPGPS
jgi:hypothetical protein